MEGRCVVSEMKFIVQRAPPGDTQEVGEVRAKLARFRAEHPEVAAWLGARVG
jgi:hypothetical protein